MDFHSKVAIFLLLLLGWRRYGSTVLLCRSQEFYCVFIKHVFSNIRDYKSDLPSRGFRSLRLPGHLVIFRLHWKMVTLLHAGELAACLKTPHTEWRQNNELARTCRLLRHLDYISSERNLVYIIPSMM